MAEPAELLAESGSSEPLHGPDPWTPNETLLERLCQRLCEIALVVSIVMIGAEVVSRALFHFSFQVTDEIGGYLLVAISFLSLPVAQVHHGFHHVEFVQARLSPSGRAWSRLFFDLLCLLCIAILLWQLVRLELRSWSSGDVAPTILATPLWIPRLTMPLGMGVLLLTLLRTMIGDCRRIAALRRNGSPPRARPA
jgi:TRAP-type C4-dicarboxylate transport system permease small subunit